jgi:serine/threonine protein kinase
MGSLGTGGIASVYRALDKRTGDEVALKLLSSGPALDAMAARRMAREFEALAELSHPNIVRVFDAGVYRGYPYLTMELVDGLTLKDYLALDSGAAPLPVPPIARRITSPSISRVSWDEASEEEEVHPSRVMPEPFDLSRLAEEPNSDLSVFSDDHSSGEGPDALRRLADAIDEPFTDEGDEPDGIDAPAPARSPEPEPQGPKKPTLAELNRPERIGRLKDAALQLCEALAYVHGHGLVHRDLKPANIMVDGDHHVKLMDFGLAKFLAEDSTVTASGRIVGTYRYMAPEQLMGEPVDARADLYSMGVMLYELLVGRPPFDAKNPMEMLHQVLDQDAQPIRSMNPVVDDPLARLVHRLLRKDPAERFQTAEEVFEALVE